MTKGHKIVAGFAIGMALLPLGTMVGTYATGYWKRQPARLKVQFAYPVTSIDPQSYDDWESVFIGNHIYPRMLPDADRPELTALTDSLTIHCDSPGESLDSERCGFVQITFKPRVFTDCLGRSYSVADLRDEFEKLLAAKSWVLPDWRRCDAGQDSICVRGRNTRDLERRMENVNFRFGWSKINKTDTVFGVGPYCLHSVPSEKGAFTSGAMKPAAHAKSLPEIIFDVSQSPDDPFSIALYGSKNLLAGRRKNVQAHTPLAYYVITNPRLEGVSLPWNTHEAKEAFNSFLVNHEVFFSDGQALNKLVPPGQALQSKAATSRKGLKFIIPDYLPECQRLADTMSRAWRDAGASAICTDVVTFAMQKVRGPKRDWDGFLVGLSPSDPGRDSIKAQYFSPTSSDSWTYDTINPEPFYYLVGMGQSIVTVDASRVCDIKPNPLGLGDIFVTDLLPCRRAD